MAGRGRAHGQERWEQFQRVAHMQDHWWWRPGWRVGRRLYTWHLTFDRSPEVRRIAKLYQDAIHLDFLDPVPPHGLHLTMQGVGFADEVDDDELQALAEAARRECEELAPFDLAVGPAYPETEGVPLAVEPWEPVEEVRMAVRRAIATVRGPENVPDPAEGFVPHITVFYSNSADADAEPLRAALAPLRHAPPIRTQVRSVSLIRLSRDTHEYRWTTEAEVPLGHGMGG